jgi:hypothetical protein
MNAKSIEMSNVELKYAGTDTYASTHAFSDGN